MDTGFLDGMNFSIELMLGVRTNETVKVLRIWSTNLGLYSNIHIKISTLEI
jgi:hypothetical protein